MVATTVTIYILIQKGIGHMADTFFIIGNCCQIPRCRTTGHDLVSLMEPFGSLASFAPEGRGI